MINFLGWTSFVLFVSMQLPQICKTLASKNVQGVSVYTWYLSFSALVLSAIYLWLFNEVKPWPMILNQVVCSVMSLFQIILYYRYHKN